MRTIMRRAMRKARLTEWQAVVSHTPARVTEAAMLGFFSLSPWNRFLRWQRAVEQHWWVARELATNTYGAGRMASRGVSVVVAPNARAALFPWGFIARPELVWGLPDNVSVHLVDDRVEVDLRTARWKVRRKQFVASQARKNGLELTLRSHGLVSLAGFSFGCDTPCDSPQSPPADVVAQGEAIRHVSSSDPSINVDITAHLVIKRRQRDRMGPKPGTLIDEFRALERLSPHPSFMAPVSYHTDERTETLTQTRATGVATRQFWQDADPRHKTCLIASLADASAWALHQGVEHRDWTAENVLATDRGAARVIDLDQGVFVAPRDAVRNILPRRYMRRLVPWNHYDELVESLDPDASIRSRIRSLSGQSSARDRDSYLAHLYDDRWHALSCATSSWRTGNWRVHGERSALVALMLWIHGAGTVTIQDSPSRAALDAVAGSLVIAPGSDSPSHAQHALWLGRWPGEQRSGDLVVLPDRLATSTHAVWPTLVWRGASCGYSTFQVVGSTAGRGES